MNFCDSCSADDTDDPSGEAQAMTKQIEDMTEEMRVFYDSSEEVEVEREQTIDKYSTSSEINVIKEFLEGIRGIVRSLKAKKKDPTLYHISCKIAEFWEHLRTFSGQTNFHFKDGRVTDAVKQGKFLLLEDFNLPNQAVTERLNSLLEPERSFTLNEDITMSKEENMNLTVDANFQFIATVHQENAFTKVNISPASMSRFTVIRIPSYDHCHLGMIIESEFERRLLHFNPCHAKDILFEFYSLLQEKDVLVSLNMLFQWVDFIINEEQEDNLFIKIFQGVYFLCGTDLDESEYLSILRSWFEHHADKYPIQFDYQYAENVFRFVAGYIDKPVRCENGCIVLEYSKIVVPSNLDKPLRLSMIPSKTLLKNIANIMARVVSNSPIILEGPPGAGKTAAVAAISSMLGHKFERINLSASSTKEELFGSILPSYVNRRRVFQWRSGPVLSAIEKGDWILFDELNLAPSELLEALTPLLQREEEYYIHPHTGDPLSLKHLQIFATMNPVSCGARFSLPRSISNLFSTVKVAEYTTEELCRIFEQSMRGEHNLDNVGIFKVHHEICDAIKNGIITDPSNTVLNLRDLLKVKDIIRGNASDQIEFTKNEIMNKRSQLNEEQAEIITIHKFLQLGYAARFSNDFRSKVQSIIDANFPLPEQSSELLSNTISSEDGYVRIGSVFLACGSYLGASTKGKLVHTPETVNKLEMLALATQSKRTVLVEGDIASGKTELVKELARITNNELVTIPMSQNTETTDLIGFWIPIKAKELWTKFDEELANLAKQIARGFLLEVQKLGENERAHMVSQLKKIYLLHCDIQHSKKKFDECISIGKMLIEEVNMLISEYTELLVLDDIKQSTKSYFSYLERLCSRIEHKIEYYEKETKNTPDAPTFVFVESPLLDAMSTGKWVLFDNVNLAPQEVIERLNSLFEEDPSLTVYEDGKVRVLSRDNGIHSQFRLFLTSNPNRICQ